jgi:hypothetical protein
MIVYAGKQFWNDFNNWDEALFQDANRPRDDFKFKIQHWLQANKQDWRTANKNINMAQALVKWAVLTWANTLAEPVFKTKYTSSDFSFLVWYTPNWWTAITSNQVSQYAGDREMDVWQWDACISVQNWHCVVNKAWTYILEAWGEFIYPSWYNASSSYQYIEFVELATKEKESDQRQRVIATTDRACWTTSYRKASYVTYATQWTLLQVRAWHTYWSNVWIGLWLNAYRLS